MPRTITETKHTPGPWRVHPYEINVGPYNKGRDVGPDGRSVAQVIGEFEKSTPGDEAEANASLIAAAPELLAALRNITECAEAGADGANMDLWIEQARAAIAKAEGR